MATKEVKLSIESVFVLLSTKHADKIYWRSPTTNMIHPITQLTVSEINRTKYGEIFIRIAVKPRD